MIGSFGDIPFEVSPERLRTFRDMSRKVAGRWSEHDIVAREPTLEFLGPSLDEISLTIRLSAQDGVHPREELDRLAQMVRGGIVEALVIGTEFFGMFALLDTSEARIIHASGGELMLAEVTLSLKEYFDEL